MGINRGSMLSIALGLVLTTGALGQPGAEQAKPAGAATQPAVDDLATLRAKGEEAQARVTEATDKIKREIAAAPDVRSALADVRAKYAALEEARKSGSPQDRLSASSAYNHARVVAEKLQAERLASRDAELRPLRDKAEAAAASYSKAKQKADDAEATRAAAEEQKQSREEMLKKLPAAPIVRGELMIALAEAKIGVVPLTLGGHPDGQSADPLLIVLAGVYNHSTTRKISYTTWGGGIISIHNFAVLRDDLGNVYKRISFGLDKPAGRIDGDSIYPGASLVDVLVFEVPVDGAKRLTLELPGDNIGLDEILRFDIPVEKIQRPEIHVLNGRHRRG